MYTHPKSNVDRSDTVSKKIFKKSFIFTQNLAWIAQEHLLKNI